MSLIVPKVITLVSVVCAYALMFVEGKKARRVLTQIVLYETALALLFVIKALELEG